MAAGLIFLSFHLSNNLFRSGMAGRKRLFFDLPTSASEPDCPPRISVRAGNPGPVHFPGKRKNRPSLRKVVLYLANLFESRACGA
jgi:hypothetical protein